MKDGAIPDERGRGGMSHEAALVERRQNAQFVPGALAERTPVVQVDGEGGVAEDLRREEVFGGLENTSKYSGSYDYSGLLSNDYSGLEVFCNRDTIIVGPL